MFTGLIEDKVKIINFTPTLQGSTLETECYFADEISLGDSISVNGCCLTVTKISGDMLSFEVSKETLNVSNFKSLKTGQFVNIERAMSANSRFDGHIVSGHIDGTAEITEIIKDGFCLKFKFKTSDEVAKYIVRKGSIAINGISLTIASCSANTFSIEVIPHTLEKTTLQTAKIGEIVNIETDILARYVEKFLSLKNNNGMVSMELLQENGYI